MGQKPISANMLIEYNNKIRVEPVVFYTTTTRHVAARIANDTTLADQVIR